jgi:ribosomal-protein-alanine N-acetyltransferase
VEFILRPYAAPDFETLYQIDQQCYAPEIAYSRRDLHEYMCFPGAECVISETEGSQVAGFCLTACRMKRGHIITMDVLPRYRRLGVATALLQEVEAKLAAQGAREVWLETATDNDGAIAFWDKHGYRKRGVWKRYYPGGRDAYAMSKEICLATPRAQAGRENS